VSLVTDYQLGQRVVDFVREHHGTTVMRYFADKAGAEGAGLDAFRYPGPRPQSRETAIAMIGDRLEATARVTVLETLDHCQALVSETIAGLAEESQFDDSGLGEDDLQAVELAFAHTLHAMHHRRITYPPRRVRDSGARLRQAIGIGRSRGRP
jgi:membrane-associated HD superfamily phosphohydrolase